MPILFGLTLIIIVFLHFGKSGQKNAKKASEEFWKKDRQSHFVPKKDISSLEYLTISYASLPLRYWAPGEGAPVRISNDAPLRFVSVPEDLAGASGEVTMLSEASFNEAYTHTANHSAPLAEELADAEHELCMLAGSRILNLTGISNIRDMELHPRTVGNAEF